MRIAKLVDKTVLCDFTKQWHKRNLTSLIVLTWQIWHSLWTKRKQGVGSDHNYIPLLSWTNHPIGHGNLTAHKCAVLFLTTLASAVSQGLMDFAAGLSLSRQCCQVLGYSRRHDMKVCFVQVAVPNPQKDKKWGIWTCILYILGHRWASVKWCPLHLHI